ncbi:hypothetical protein [Methylobacterium indicum]|nr:hypothetical protein [Methylobacterium indicum]
MAGKAGDGPGAVVPVAGGAPEGALRERDLRAGAAGEEVLGTPGM